MQQRVGLARALVNEPAVLLMDEPFSALDPLIRREMQSELIQLQTQIAKTIVFITHDLDEALRLGDHIAVMKDGIIHQIGTPEDLLRSPATDYVAEFVQGMNPWSVLRAEHIMNKPDALLKKKDGPRVALREMRKHQISSVFVIDDRARLAGIVTADDALSAIERKETDLLGCLTSDIPAVFPDISLEELVPMGATAKYPIPVISKDGRLLGIVVRSGILSGLASRPSVTPSEQEQHLQPSDLVQH